ncbi:MAG: alkylation response protein AidB-like acyl-CoA dehydrogenase [Myxococcota bacterium]|jgi:alkylation response protein AidB-like acyl-CoA dehydrogenase
MEFVFSEDQLLLQQTVRDFLEGECTVEHIRAMWETDTGRSPEFWAKLAEIGVPGLLVPDEHGGMGMNEVDMVLVLEETGRAGLAEPVIPTAFVGVPLLAEAGGDVAKEWLPKVAEGAAILAVGHEQSPFVSDAHIADLLLLSSGDAVHAVPSSAVKLTAQAANDPAKKISSVEWTPSAATLLADGDAGRALQAAAFDRGTLACAAQLLGVAQQLIDMAVLYATQRKQFGVPIGSFQSIKHMLANEKVKVEYARTLVYRAADSVANATPGRAVDVSMAKIATGEAAVSIAKTALQVHGALGYTWEQDLHVWMRRAWSLDASWGSLSFHKRRLAEAVIDGKSPAVTFGYETPAA